MLSVLADAREREPAVVFDRRRSSPKESTEEIMPGGQHRQDRPSNTAPTTRRKPELIVLK
jgi:hypothetical protein